MNQHEGPCVREKCELQPASHRKDQEQYRTGPPDQKQTTYQNSGRIGGNRTRAHRKGGWYDSSYNTSAASVRSSWRRAATSSWWAVNDGDDSGSFASRRLSPSRERVPLAPTVGKVSICQPPCAPNQASLHLAYVFGKRGG
jgi:hypothetical protein